MAAATAAPWAAQAAEAGSGTGSLLLAVGVGAAVALAAVAVVLRSRDRRAAGLPHQALTAACAFWWRTDAAGRIVEIEPGRLAAGGSTEPLRGRLLWDPFDDAATLDAVEAAFRDGRSFASVPCPGSAAFGPSFTLSGSPLLSPAGALLGFTGIA